MATQLTAWFITLESDLEDSGGGVQLCTNEYWQTLKQTGFRLIAKPFPSDGQLLTRIRRRLFPRPFANTIPAAFLKGLALELSRNPPDALFFNRVNAAPAASMLRVTAPNLPFVLLSHGLMLVDELCDASANENAGAWRRSWLGDILLTESAQRREFDLVITLTSEECVIERWLGSRRTIWVPRVLKPEPLDWKPVEGRVGFVGTLSHPPSRHALDLLLDELKKMNLPNAFEFRVVGNPPGLGEEVQRRYRFVKFLGPLPEHELVGEAATWCCFAHPLFVFARGCSTKLATGLGWQLPILTTVAGKRGYTWGEGKLAIADDPREFANQLLQLSSLESARVARQQTILAGASMPTLSDTVAIACSEFRALGLGC